MCEHVVFLEFERIGGSIMSKKIKLSIAAAVI